MAEVRLHDGSSIEVEIYGEGRTVLLPVNPRPVAGPQAEEMRKYGADPALGQRRWKEVSAYHCRSLAETAVFRFKTLFGGHLIARTFDRQMVEALIKCKALNVMTQLGLPDSYPVVA